MWRYFLLPVVAAVIGGGLLAAQLRTRTIDLDTAEVSPAAEGAFLGQARAEAPELHAADDLQLMRIGIGLCAAVERVPERAASPRTFEGLTAAELYAVTDAATRHLCPAQRAKVTSYLRDGR